MFLATIYFFRYLGLKGIIGLTIGLFTMAWLLLSNNELLLYFVNLFSREDYQSIIEFKKFDFGENGKGKETKDHKHTEKSEGQGRTIKTN